MAAERLRRWCQAAAGGDWLKFRRRLRWDGVSLAQAHSALGEPSESSGPLPSWTATLQALVETGAAAPCLPPPDTHPSLLDPNEPVPFEELLAVFVSAARGRLLARLGAPLSAANPLAPALLSDAAYAALERQLLCRLSYLAAGALYAEFSRVRPVGLGLFALLTGAPAAPGRGRYEAFVGDLARGGLWDFFRRYPVLGRLLAECVDAWVEATSQFLERLLADRQEIARAFGPGAEDPGPLVSLAPGLSDPHFGGRTVASLRFASGIEVYYKPRDLGLEADFAHLQRWCNEAGLSPSFRPLRILARSGYGWVEAVLHRPCADEAAVARYFERAGMLLGLLHVLGATDCHSENLVASGEHPVLVDGETLMVPEPRPLAATVAPDELSESVRQSVLRTALLPRWALMGDGTAAFEVSGLGSVEAQPSPVAVPQWRAVNTDGMHGVSERQPLPAGANVPRLGDAAQAPHEHAEAIVAGFEKMLGFLRAHRDRLLDPEGPLAGLRDKSSRFIFRETWVYEALLQQSLTPECLQSGVERSLRLESASRAFIASGRKPSFWPLLRAELLALERLDIPHLQVTVAGLRFSPVTGMEGSRYLRRSAWEEMLLRLNALDERAIALQVAMIRGSLQAKVARRPAWKPEAPPAGTVRHPSLRRHGPDAPLSPQALIEQARVIAERILAQGVRQDDGRWNWLGLGYLPGAQRFQLDLAGESLYEGRCGIALFLAAHGRVTGEARYGEAALGALAAIRRSARTRGQATGEHIARDLGIGGAMGLGGTIYTLAHASRLLGEPALLEEAARLARWISPRLAEDRDLDVTSGAAGALLGLLALSEDTGDATALRQAVDCGEHLLALQERNGRLGAWPGRDGRTLTGFAHGAAGIAYALLRLYKETGCRAHLDAARAGVAWERSVFSETARNWPDFRPLAMRDGQPGFMLGWCHGAPGIGLARLGGAPMLGDEQTREEIEVALETTLRAGGVGTDHLCCGTLGHSELCLVAAGGLDRPALRVEAARLAARVVERAAGAGAYRLFEGELPDSYSPGFFRGLAGIGYQLLRLSEPSLPSVLLWE